MGIHDWSDDLVFWLLLAIAAFVLADVAAAVVLALLDLANAVR